MFSVHPGWRGMPLRRRIAGGTVAFACLCGVATSAKAGELILTAGGGQQLGSSQENKIFGLDYGFFEWERSHRQKFTIGISYSYLETNHGSDEDLYAISIYPQLTLFPGKESWARRHLPGRAAPFFFVRALGPTYISETEFGDREQSEHLTFQAQVGVGLTFTSRTGRESSLTVSWKHFSNANLFSDNDGFDFPLVVSYGLRL